MQEQHRKEDEHGDEHPQVLEENAKNGGGKRNDFRKVMSAPAMRPSPNEDDAAGARVEVCFRLAEQSSEQNADIHH